MNVLIWCSFLLLWQVPADIPKEVRAAFQQDFPHISVMLWEYGREGYVATFKQAEDLQKAVYSPEGEWKETRTRILLRDLPADLLRQIKLSTGTARITHVARVTCPSGLQYRIESELHDAVVIRVFSESGALLREETFAFSTFKA
jgi:hypothetical protein